jgi:hypothetical protein
VEYPYGLEQPRLAACTQAGRVVILKAEEDGKTALFKGGNVTGIEFLQHLPQHPHGA